MLSTSFYVWHTHATPMKSLFSFATVTYSSRATLFFRSGFESPVEFADSTKQHLEGGDQEAEFNNWEDLPDGDGHRIYYGSGTVVPTEANAEFSTTYVHGGSRSLHFIVNTRGRCQLNVYFSDTRSTELFTRAWHYYPNTDINLNTHLIGLQSSRQVGTDSLYGCGTGWYRDISGNYHFDEEYGYWSGYDWYWRARNDTYTLPEGQWVKVERYVKRDATNGRVKVWMDDVLVLDSAWASTVHSNNHPKIGENEPTKTANNNLHGRVVAKIYTESSNRPFEMYVDDIEYWYGSGLENGDVGEDA